jgi:hypothetical protein
MGLVRRPTLSLNKGLKCFQEQPRWAVGSETTFGSTSNTLDARAHTHPLEGPALSRYENFAELVADKRERGFRRSKLAAPLWPATG